MNAPESHIISVAFRASVAAIMPGHGHPSAHGAGNGCDPGERFGRSNENALRANRVIVLKRQRTLQLLKDGKVIKSYKVALGANPVGPKTKQGDHKTPEGSYFLDSRNSHSHFYKALHISYPNARDRTIARQKGVSPGGDVFVHGLPNGYGFVGASHSLKDWTDGCVAVTNEEMDEIWRVVPNGTPIEIRP
jgi:murein L,D-transpeptidase YafK